MGYADIVNPNSIVQAIQEFEYLGRGRFLKEYGFGKSRVYFLKHNNKYYDSKAIVAVAYKYEFPNEGALTPQDFSGGENTVGKLLTELGFEIERKDEPFPEPEDVLSHVELMRAFGVGLQGGMRRSHDNNLLLLISDPTKSIYDDRWEGNIMHYTGMGKVGDQTLTSQNKTLAESNSSDISIHLCEVFKPTEYTYIGEVELVDEPYQEYQVDTVGNDRLVYIFPIRLKGYATRPKPKKQDLDNIREIRGKYLKNKSLEELKRIASKARKKPERILSETIQIVRSQAVVEYVKSAAKGVCGLCENNAPFKNKKKEPYLECHHVVPLAEDGEDSIENAVALCPNCHRKMHVVIDKKDIQTLLSRIKTRESV